MGVHIHWIAIVALGGAWVNATTPEMSALSSTAPVTHTIDPSSPLPVQTSSHSVSDDNGQKTCSTLTITVTSVLSEPASTLTPIQTPSSEASKSPEQSTPAHTPSPSSESLTHIRSTPTPPYPTLPTPHDPASTGTAPTGTAPSGTGTHPTSSGTPPDFTGAAVATNVPAGVAAMLGLAAFML